MRSIISKILMILGSAVIIYVGVNLYKMEVAQNHYLKLANTKIEKESKELEQVLAEALGLEKVTLLRCGGGNPIAGAREQWNDGANTLAIAPGEVVVYARNHVTNKLLQEAGIKLHIMPSSELSRGRGGPRCMSMPLWREEI